VPTLTELPQWTIRTAGHEVTFVPAPAGRGRRPPAAPRVWAGRGLALHEDDLPPFAKALGEVMKLPAYWSARAGATSRAADDEAAWPAPRHDPGDGFVHFTGPCGRPGSLPAGSFVLDLADVRVLRIRVSAYLHERRR
jgi:hypothetical protein